MPEGLSREDQSKSAWNKEYHDTFTRKSEQYKEDSMRMQKQGEALLSSGDLVNDQDPELARKLWQMGSQDRSKAGEARSDAFAMEARRDAILWEARQHVEAHLPEYKVTADREMQAETDGAKKFEPGANDALAASTQPQVDQPPGSNYEGTNEVDVHLPQPGPQPPTETQG